MLRATLLLLWPRSIVPPAPPRPSAQNLVLLPDPSLGLVVKLIDLDSVKRKGAPVGTSGLTHAYCAPELARATLQGTVAECTASPKHDAFSLGLVFLEVFTGSHLLQAEMEQDARTQPSSAPHSKVRPISARFYFC